MYTKLSCDGYLSKHILIFINFLLLVCGVAILAFCVIIMTNPAYLINATMNLNVNDTQIFHFERLPENYIMCFFATGPILILISLIGCFGSIYLKPCCLILYTMIIVVALLLEITSGYALVFYQKEADDLIRKWLLNNLKNEYQISSKDAISQVWDHVFSNLYCCGINGGSDFQYSLFQNTTNLHIPKSCCRPTNSNEISSSTCPSIFTDENSYSSKGCFEVIIAYVMMYRSIIAYVLIAIVSIEIITVVSAVVLLKSRLSSRKVF